jgi:hypothetical protein
VALGLDDGHQVFLERSEAVLAAGLHKRLYAS